MISLAKDDRTKVDGRIINFALGWDAATKSSVGGVVGGLLAKFAGTSDITTPTSVDLDASAILFAGNQKVGEVSFRTLYNLPNGTKHSGDNRSGQGKGDDEVITIDTSKLDPNVDTVIITVNSYSGQALNAVQNAYCRLDVDGQQTAQMVLDTKVASSTAVVMGRFYKKDGQWRFQNISEFFNASTASSMTPILQRFM